MNLFNDIIFTTSLSLLKSTGRGTNLSTSISSTLLSNCLNYLEHLSTLDFKLAKLTFLANFDVSAPVSVFKSGFLA